MKSKIVLRVLCLSATAFILFWIFIMSNQNADDSAEMSGKVGYTIAKVIKKDFEKLPEKEKQEYVEEIDHTVRKSAHFTEFAALGAFIMFDLCLFDIKKPLAAYFTVLSGFVFACLDELHQIFIPGRACMFTDVLIDTGGVALGCACALLLVIIIEAVKKRKHKKTAEN